MNGDERKVFRLPTDFRCMMIAGLVVLAVALANEAVERQSRGDKVACIAFTGICVYAALAIYRSRVEVLVDQVRIVYLMHTLSIPRPTILRVRLDSRLRASLVVSPDPRRVQWPRDITLPVESAVFDDAHLVELASVLDVPLFRRGDAP